MKNTRCQKLTYNSVRHLLSNCRYIGEYSYQDIVAPESIPAIVPQDLFDRVQEKLAKNRRAPAHHRTEDDYLLTTKLFCGCGACLCGESGTSRTGNTHRCYKCVSVKKERQKSHRNLVIETLINAMFLSDNKMVITFNCKEGTTIITFAHLKEALADNKPGSDLDCPTAPNQ